MSQSDAQGGRVAPPIPGLRRPGAGDVGSGLRPGRADPQPDSARIRGGDLLPRLFAQRAGFASTALLPGTDKRLSGHRIIFRDFGERAAANDARVEGARGYSAVAIHLRHHRHCEGGRDHAPKSGRKLRAAERVRRRPRGRHHARGVTVVSHHRDGMPDEHDGVRRRIVGRDRPFRSSDRAARDRALSVQADDADHHGQCRNRQLPPRPRVRPLVAACLLLGWSPCAPGDRPTVGGAHRLCVDRGLRLERNHCTDAHQSSTPAQVRHDRPSAAAHRRPHRQSGG